MNKWIMTALFVSLASQAQAADAPSVVPPAPQPIVGLAGPSCCTADCDAKVCVSVPGIKKKDKYIYDEKCVDYCIPHCGLFSIFCGSCGCDAGNQGCLKCGGPWTKHLLVKKIVHEECPEVKCEVQPAPCAVSSMAGEHIDK